MSEPFDAENEALAGLGESFLSAMALKRNGRLDEAESSLRDILKAEPRLAEPHMELARILLDTGRRTEAEEHAREAVTHLQQGDTWVEDIPPDVVRALAHALLAEVLRQRADEDDIIFGDPAVFHEMVAEAKLHFARAAELDPGDEFSSYHAFFLGPKGHGSTGETEASEPE